MQLNMQFIHLALGSPRIYPEKHHEETCVTVPVLKQDRKMSTQ